MELYNIIAGQLFFHVVGLGPVKILLHFSHNVGIKYYSSGLGLFMFIFCINHLHYINQRH